MLISQQKILLAFVVIWQTRWRDSETVTAVVDRWSANPTSLPHGTCEGWLFWVFYFSSRIGKLGHGFMEGGAGFGEGVWIHSILE